MNAWQLQVQLPLAIINPERTGLAGTYLRGTAVLSSSASTSRRSWASSRRSSVGMGLPSAGHRCCCPLSGYMWRRRCTNLVKAVLRLAPVWALVL